MSKTKTYHAQIRQPDGSYVGAKILAKNAREAAKKLDQEHGDRWVMAQHTFTAVVEEKGVGRHSVRVTAYDEADARWRLEQEYGAGSVLVDSFEYIRD